MDSIEEEMYISALDNAQKYEGKATVGPVMGKIMSSHKECRAQAKEIKQKCLDIIQKVNNMSREEQIAQLQKLAPELLEKKKGSKKDALPDLPDAVDGKVVTRFPPEPNGYPHIGHAYSALMNYLYAKKYNGKLVLRFEDTNPRGEEKKYYDVIKKGLQWLGIEWDEEKRISDDIPLIYTYAETLIQSGDLYACDCPLDTIRDNRAKKMECSCRNRSSDENMTIFQDMKMKKYKEGEILFRLKSDMASTNGVMRDPAMLRIIDANHPIHGDTYYVYPTYDLAVAIEDAICGITHVMRSNEFAPRIELQEYIRTLLKLSNPKIIQYSRFNIEGTPSSKRKIKSLLESEIVLGWDDPRLSTLEGLKRRGILSKTLKDLTIEIGPSTAEPVISWDILNSLNRKNLDPTCPRFFVVYDPVNLHITNAEETQVSLKKHPDHSDLGIRNITTKKDFYISKDDVSSMSVGEVIRLKDLYNVKIVSIEEEKVVSEYIGNEILKETKKIHWIPLEEAVPTKIIFLDKLLIDENVNESSFIEYSGFGEKSLLDLEKGAMLQMERVGFGRIDEKNNNTLTIMKSH